MVEQAAGALAHADDGHKTVFKRIPWGNQQEYFRGRNEFVNAMWTNTVGEMAEKGEPVTDLFEAASRIYYRGLFTAIYFGRLRREEYPVPLVFQTSSRFADQDVVAATSPYFYHGSQLLRHMKDLAKYLSDDLN